MTATEHYNPPSVPGGSSIPPSYRQNDQYDNAPILPSHSPTGPNAAPSQLAAPTNPLQRRQSSYGQSQSIGPWDSASNYGGDHSEGSAPINSRQDSGPSLFARSTGLSHIPEANVGDHMLHDSTQGYPPVATSSHYDPWGERPVPEHDVSRLEYEDEGADRQSLLTSAAGFAGRDEEAAASIGKFDELHTQRISLTGEN